MGWKPLQPIPDRESKKRVAVTGQRFWTELCTWEFMWAYPYNIDLRTKPANQWLVPRVREGAWKDCKSQKFGRTWKNNVFLTWQNQEHLSSQQLWLFEQDQANQRPAWRGEALTSLRPQLRSRWKLIASEEKRVSFLSRCGPRQVGHAHVHTMCTWIAQIEQPGIF